jgi:hypothetical protein
MNKSKLGMSEALKHAQKHTKTFYSIFLDGHSGPTFDAIVMAFLISGYANNIAGGPEKELSYLESIFDDAKQLLKLVHEFTKENQNADKRAH